MTAVAGIGSESEELAVGEWEYNSSDEAENRIGTSAVRLEAVSEL
jgi:hypothetical protein